jgi:hypothetical protein
MAAGRTLPGIHPRVFHSASTNRDPHLLAEEVTKRGEVFGGHRMVRGNSFPLLIISQGLRLGGSFLSPHTLAAVRVALLSCLLCFCAYRLSLLARLASCLTASSGKVTPTGRCTHTQGPA